MHNFSISLQGTELQPQPSTISLALLPFQQRNLNWLLSRESVQPSKSIIIGGLLADEMGLGKTIQLLSLIAMNSCTLQLERMSSGATLIIVPNTILHQWHKEIQKYTNLACIIYSGVNSSCSLEQLIETDIVLVPFQILRNDYFFMQPASDRPRRHQQKYIPRRSPLVEIKWWRIIVDEAQIVETKNKCSDILPQLCSVYRWASTGTPFCGKNFYAEFHHLMAYLSGGMWDYRKCASPIQVERVLNEIMRRNTKELLARTGEKTFTVMHERLWLLGFDKVQMEWYRTSEVRILNEISSRKQVIDMLQIDKHYQVEAKEIKKLDSVINRLQRELNMYMKSSLLDLRHMCCLLSDVDRNFEDKGMTMVEILEMMLNKARMEGEVVFRRNYNLMIDLGIAFEMLKRYEEAKEMYENALEEIEIGTKRARQKVIEEKAKKEENRKRKGLDTDDEIETEKSGYSAYNNLLHWLRVLHRVLFCLGSISHKLDLSIEETAFYDRAAVARQEILSSALLKYEKFRCQIKAETVAVHEMQSEESEIEYMIVNLHELHILILSVRSDLLNLLGPLEEKREAEEDEYAHTLDVAQRIDILNDLYKYALMTKKELLTGERFTSQSFPILRDHSALELYACLPKFRLGGVQKSLKQLKGESSAVETHYKQQMEFVEKADREWHLTSRLVNLRVVYFRQLQELSDDVTMPENIPSQQIISEMKNRIEQSRIESASIESRIAYLNQLTESADRMCAICRLDCVEAVVTPCGHFYCSTCLNAWLNCRLSCPICNLKLRKDQIIHAIHSYAENTTSYLPEDLEHMEIHNLSITGSFGAKIDFIVKHILYLQSKDSQFKCIVFSQWDAVLEAIARACALNDIETISFSGKKRKSSPATEFETNPQIRALLLNARSQASGLSLTCASHVFLVEPIAHPGLELQAISRIRRINQDKDTYIYRYVIESTVESKVHELWKSKKEQAQSNVKKEDMDESELEFCFNK